MSKLDDAINMCGRIDIYSDGRVEVSGSALAKQATAELEGLRLSKTRLGLRAAEAETRIESALELLKQTEWHLYDDDENQTPYCWECFGTKESGHFGYCKLHLELKGGQK